MDQGGTDTTGGGLSRACFVDALPGPLAPAARTPFVVGVLPGEGIGPEVVSAALEVLRAVGSATSHRFEVRTGGAIGQAAVAACGSALSPDVADFFASTFADGGAVLCGAGGGRFVYELRARFDLYVKVVPLRPVAALRDVGVLRPEVLDGVDLLVVRENAGGLYLGRPRLVEESSEIVAAEHTFGYSADEVDRTLEVGFRLAAARRGRAVVVTKPGGLPSISALWQDRARRHPARADIDVEFLDVDNASYQIVADPGRFDVVVAPNLFGDILGDGAGVLVGSRGVTHSANFGADGRAVYQTAHGSAHDLTNTDRANPIGQIRSLESLLRHSFRLDEAAVAVEAGIESVLASGYRTADVMAPGCTLVGTRELGERVAEAVGVRLSGDAPAVADAASDAAA